MAAVSTRRPSLAAAPDIMSLASAKAAAALARAVSPSASEDRINAASPAQSFQCYPFLPTSPKQPGSPVLSASGSAASLPVFSAMPPPAVKENRTETIAPSAKKVGRCTIGSPRLLLTAARRAGACSRAVQIARSRAERVRALQRRHRRP
jgi:hypothetical protein